MSKYVCKREGVCAGGLLIRWDEKENHNRLNLDLLNDRFLVFKYKTGRVMLFNINENKMTNDLIYNTPNNYPILDLNLDNKIDNKFIINRYVNLDELLKYLGYGIDLTQGDLNHIYKKLIISKKWLEQNKNLFGNNHGEEFFSSDMYDVLEYLYLMPNKPCKDEPGYSLIKRKK